MKPSFDPGLQPERTELAWRRTSLSVGVGSLVAARLLPESFRDAAWALVAVPGLLFALLVWWGARRRHRAVNEALAPGGSAALPGAGLLLAVALACMFIGIAALTVVVVMMISGA